MRTSGGGSRDVLMLAVPLGILVVFAVSVGGGIMPSVRVLEGMLEAFAAWVGDFF